MILNLDKMKGIWYTYNLLKTYKKDHKDEYYFLKTDTNRYSVTNKISVVDIDKYNDDKSMIKNHRL